MRKDLLRDLVVLLVLIGMAVLVFIYNMPHRNVLAEEPQFSLSLPEMNNEFLTDEKLAYNKYFNQVVEISGIATEINNKGEHRYDIVLTSQGVIANGEIIQTKVLPIRLLDKKVKLKGLFIGYDNLLEEIKLRECSIKISNDLTN